MHPAAADRAHLAAIRAVVVDRTAEAAVVATLAAATRDREPILTPGPDIFGAVAYPERYPDEPSGPFVEIAKKKIRTQAVYMSEARRVRIQPVHVSPDIL